jgi:hypothetical protein
MHRLIMGRECNLTPLSEMREARLVVLALPVLFELFNDGKRRKASQFSTRFRDFGCFR